MHSESENKKLKKKQKIMQKILTLAQKIKAKGRNYTQCLMERIK